MTPQDFAKRWRWENLVKPPENSLKNLKLPDETKFFLLEAGLPVTTETQHSINFSMLSSGIQKLSDCIEKGERQDKYRSFLRIGATAAGQICLEEITGQVFVIYPKLDKTRFVNSSVSQLAESILVYTELLERFWN